MGCWIETGTLFIVKSALDHCFVVMFLSYRLLDSAETGGGDTQGHGMVLALHMMKQLKSSQKFSELLTIKYDSICRWLHCLKPVREQLIVSIFVHHLR